MLEGTLLVLRCKAKEVLMRTYKSSKNGPSGKFSGSFGSTLQGTGIYTNDFNEGYRLWEKIFS